MVTLTINHPHQKAESHLFLDFNQARSYLKEKYNITVPENEYYYEELDGTYIQLGYKSDYNSIVESQIRKETIDKPPVFTLIARQFPLAILEVAKCSQGGHLKYPLDQNWDNFKSVDPNIDGTITYLEAALRHLIESKGELVYNEDMKPYGNILHLAQAAWNILAHLEILIALNNKESKP